MRLGELDTAEYRRRISSEGVSVDLGIATFKVISKLKPVQDNFLKLYQEHRLLEDSEPVDFFVSVRTSPSLRKWLYPQIEFICDQHSPFLPLPKAQAYPVLEWGMNWCIASHCHNYLLLHAAVLAKDDKAILFPAPPGSGKSTLTSHLAHSGWRLLSDEMAVINTRNNRVYPFVRPICLKNNSIGLVKRWFPEVVISDIAKDTNKGDVAHVKPPKDSLEKMYNSAEIKAVVFPTFDAAAELEICELDKCSAFFELAKNGFNNNVLAKSAFNSLTSVVESVNSYEARYSELSELTQFLEDELKVSM